MLTKSVDSSKVFTQETRANQSGLTVSVMVPDPERIWKRGEAADQHQERLLRNVSSK